VAFAIAVFAPRYRRPFPKALPPGVVEFEFEDAADQIKASDANDVRAIYRARFLERAAQPKIIVAKDENDFADQWWKAVNDTVKREFGDFFIIDRQSVPKTTYVNAKCADMPTYLRLDLKGYQGEVALAFKGFPLEELKSLVAPIKPDDVVVDIRKGNKDPALRISNLSKFEIDDGLDEEVMNRVRIAYGWAHKLLSLWKVNRSMFDDAAVKRNPAAL
jgi:hypothetical protein